MCENTENIAAKRNLGICYFPEQQARIDVLLYEISQADSEEVNTSTGKQRRFDISSAHGYVALSYALDPDAEVCSQTSRIIRWTEGFFKRSSFVELCFISNIDESIDRS